MKLDDFLPGVFPELPLPRFLLREEKSNRLPVELPQEVKTFQMLSEPAQKQALKYISKWRGQDLNAATSKWRESMEDLGVTPGPITTGNFYRNSLEKISQ